MGFFGLEGALGGDAVRSASLYGAQKVGVWTQAAVIRQGKKGAEFGTEKAWEQEGGEGEPPPMTPLPPSPSNPLHNPTLLLG